MIGFSSDSTFGLRASVILLEMWMSGSQSQAVWVQLWWHMGCHTVVVWVLH